MPKRLLEGRLDLLLRPARTAFLYALRALVTALLALPAAILLGLKKNALGRNGHHSGRAANPRGRWRARACHRVLPLVLRATPAGASPAFAMDSGLAAIAVGTGLLRLQRLPLTGRFSTHDAG